MVKIKSIKPVIASLLLICFSAVALPFDIFHNHHEEELVCSDYGQDGPCSHKVHISKKKSFCFACAIHFDKSFTVTEGQEQKTDIPWIRISLENKVTSILIEPLLILLRGPPSV